MFTSDLQNGNTAAICNSKPKYRGHAGGKAVWALTNNGLDAYSNVYFSWCDLPAAQQLLQNCLGITLNIGQPSAEGIEKVFIQKMSSQAFNNNGTKFPFANMRL